jgi:hypothetical protein
MRDDPNEDQSPAPGTTRTDELRERIEKELERLGPGVTALREILEGDTPLPIARPSARTKAGDSSGGVRSNTAPAERQTRSAKGRENG